MTPLMAFALVSAVHAGFQLTVTSLVYPALAEAPPRDWVAWHDRHSRRVAPLVVLLYSGLVGTGTWLVLAGPPPLGWAALVAAAMALATTAFLAAPHHRALKDYDTTLVRRLLTVDRFRCLAAVGGASVAALANLT